MEVPRSTNRDDWIEVRAVDGAGQARVRDCGLQKDIGAGKYIPSATFSVVLPCWIYCGGGQNYAAASLELVSKADKVRVIYEFGLVNLETMQSNVVLGVMKPWVFSSTSSTWGFAKFTKRSELEGLPFLRDNRLVLECNVTVLMGMPVSESRAICGIQVSPSDLVDNLGKLLE
nr:unnamed protein product [Digitaria exilis]